MPLVINLHACTRKITKADLSNLKHLARTSG